VWRPVTEERSDGQDEERRKGKSSASCRLTIRSTIADDELSFLSIHSSDDLLSGREESDVSHDLGDSGQRSLGKRRKEEGGELDESFV